MKPNRSPFIPLALALVATLAAGGALGQKQGEETPAESPSIEQRLDAARAELRTAQGQLEAEEPGSAGAEHAARVVGLLREISTRLSQAQAEQKARGEAATAPASSPADSEMPATAEALRQLIDELGRARRRHEDLEQAVGASERARRAAQEARDEAGRARRDAKSRPGEPGEPGARRREELARLRERLAVETLYLRELELRADREALAVHERTAADLEQRVEQLRERIRQSPATAEDAGSTERAAEEGRLRRALEDARRGAESIELRLDRARASYAGQPDPPPGLLARIETLQLERDAAAQEIAELDAALGRVEQEDQLLERWGKVLRGSAARRELRDWADAASGSASELERAILQRQGRLAELVERAESAQQRLDSGAEPELRTSLEEQKRLLDRLVRLHQGALRELEAHSRLITYVRRDLESALGRVSLGERLSGLGQSLVELWRYELFAVDEDPIRVGNAVLAVLLLTAGFTLSRCISRTIRQQAERRLSLQPGVAGAIETIAFYLLLVSFALIALRTVNFPLTVFTVAGGALAIGVGFGSQNVMNNFISGLILMIERPVRARDVVEVESTHGTIEQIGARSTRIRATDGRQIIVPNSFFLENNVVNWTLSDELIRTKVVVGVIYGSPTQRVAELILQSLEENQKVLKSPKPIIVFRDFGSSSLDFEAYFWVRARAPMAVMQIESEIRFRIDDLFRENQLVIAFPQQDVHLDAVTPIEVRLTREPGNP